MYHMFNIEVAKKCGVASATIFNYLYWWIDKNKANEKHFHDGYYWTYNSRKAFISQFPYLTERQIEYALRKLIDGGYVITGNYNRSQLDRTLWYAITEKGFSILQNGEMENQNLVNAFNENVRAIPINNNTVKRTVKKSLPNGRESEAPGAVKKKSYATVFNDPENEKVRDALVRYIEALRGMNYTPKVTTVEKFAKLLKTESKGNPLIASRIVDQSISKGWKALYPLKDKQVGGVVSVPARKEDQAVDENGNPIVF